MEAIKGGDLVRLKSGGPAMTVVGYVCCDNITYEQVKEKHVIVKCVFFDKKDNLQFGDFHLNTLDRVPKGGLSP